MAVGRQNGPVQGKGLPGTACAPDFFSRIDALAPLPAQAAAMPIRDRFGWKSPLLLDIKPDSWLMMILDYIEGKPKDGWFRHGMGTVFAYVTLVVIYVMAWMADQLMVTANMPDGCNPDKLKRVQADRFFKGKLAQWGGGSVEFTTRIDDYAQNWLCPTVMVTAGDATAAYMADEVERSEWLDYCKSNGLCQISAEIIADTQRFRLGIPEVVEVWRRDLIGDDQVPEFLRRVSVLDADQVGWIKHLAADRPGKGEVVQRAALGVYSADSRARLGLDDERDQLPRPGDNAPSFAAGIDLDELREAWAGHWQAIDVQTAFELFRRGAAGLLPQGTTFGEAELNDALQNAAVPPGQRSAMLSLIFTPLGRRQIKALYDDSIIGEGQLMQYLIAGGLPPADAQLQVAQWAKLKPEYVRKRIGGKGAVGYVGMFAAGEIGTTEFLDEIQALGFTADEAQQAIVEARAQRQRKTRSALIAFLHGRFVKGDINEAQVTGVLSASGLDGEDVASLLGLWRIELEVSPKQVSTAELLDWHCRGILGDDELATRLAQLKYSIADIARIVAVADYKCMNATQAEAAKLLSRVKGSLTKAQQSWSKTLGEVGRQVGT